MGRKIRTQEEAKSVMRWLKELTGEQNLEYAIALGFHRVSVEEQQALVDLRDIYLMHFQGSVDPRICFASCRSMDRATFLENMKSLVKSDINQMYATCG